MKCCNTEIPIKQGTQNGKKLYYLTCESCGKKGKGATEKEAIESFNKSMSTRPAVNENKSLILAPLPSKKTELVKWSNDNLPALLNQSAQFIDKPATKRLIEKNVRYVANLEGKAWDKIWATEKGQESLKYALTEANYYACTLGEMGDIVPYGETAEFIPSIECFKFALETGRNAPFIDILITPIHENDTYDNSQKAGNFIFEIKRNLPRGECIGVAIEATRTDTNKIIGTILDENFLMQIAKDHSQSYKSYIIEKEDFTRMKVEGKLLKDETGREYAEKLIEYKDKEGKEKSFKKKIYEHEIVNPYVTSDRVKMLCKTAGKFFFKPYMKIRNSMAMAEEWEDEDDIQDGISREKAANSVLKASGKQFEDIKDINTANIKDAEIITENNKTMEGKNNVKDDKKDHNIGDL